MPVRSAIWLRTACALGAILAGVIVTTSPVLAQGDPVKVVILGSSTAAGANASPLSESWVNKYAAYLADTHPGSQVTNLAVGGYTIFNVMPTGNVPPSPWNQSAYLPAAGHNITAALALSPDLIIINLPTNDSDLLVPVDLQMANYAAIVTAAAAADVPVWITTPQPRNTTAAARLVLGQMVSATHEAFAGRDLDFWTGIADGAGQILASYNSDGTHLNNAGHTVLYDRVVAGVQIPEPADLFVAMHPRARIVTERDTVAFQAIGCAPGVVTYQWERNGDPLPGETASRLIIAGAAVSDSGALFQCVISSDGSSVVTDPAELRVQALPGPASTRIVSDDFSTGPLNTDVWTFRNPAGDATIGFAGTGTSDAGLTISVPGGTNHDIWTNVNAAPAILQSFTNQEFEIEARFASTPTQKYQIQGLVVQKDSANLVRFDVVQQGTRSHIFAATFINGTPTVRQDSALTGTPPQFLRLKRVGNQWTGSFSYDGSTWRTATSFTFSTVTTAGGVFAGNAGDTPAASPAFTAQIDYFFNTAAPVIPEDGPASPHLTIPSNGAIDQSSSLDLHWESTGNSIDSVLISADSTSWTFPAVTAVVPSGTATVHLDALYRGATYYWKVRCQRDDTWSAWSALARFSTAPSALAVRGSLTDTIAHFVPDTTWADAFSRSAADWSYDATGSVPVALILRDTETFLSFTLTVHWDPSRLSWAGIDAGGTVAAGAVEQLSIVDSAAGTAVLSALFADTVTAAAGAALSHMHLMVRAPGRSLITAHEVRFTMPAGGSLLHRSVVTDTLTATILLGDVASSGGVMARADGRVDFDDLSAWSLGYWSTLTDTSAGNHYHRKYDVGPTVDGTPFTLPQPDGRIDFEDLMIMARMYGTDGSTSLPRTDHAGSVTIGVEAGPEMIDGGGSRIPLLLRGSAGQVHGVALRIPGIAHRYAGCIPGPLLSSRSPAPMIFAAIRGEDVEIHMATTGGEGQPFSMDAEVVTIRLNAWGPITPELLDARDGQNHPIRTTETHEGTDAKPRSTALEQNYPNPFNPSTRIPFSLVDRQMTTLRIYDLLGREIATILHEVREPGTYILTWDASGLPSGVYLCRLTAGTFTATRRLLLLK